MALKHGRKAKPIHKLKSGRTGNVHNKKIRSRNSCKHSIKRLDQEIAVSTLPNLPRMFK